MKLILLSCLFIFSFLPSTGLGSACSGGSCGTRGGGDFLEWSFYDVAKIMVSRLLTSSDADVRDVAKKLETVFSCLVVQISEAPELILDGRSVTAINIPAECKVILSRKGWKELISDEERGRLVLHELIPLAGMIDIQYTLSKILADEYFRLVRRPVVSGANSWKIFTRTDVFYVPEDVTTIRVTVVGAGGGGGGGHLGRGAGGGGGGGGAVKASQLFVAGYKSIDVVVGEGGIGAIKGGENGNNGENSSFGNFLSAQGGGGGFSGFYNTTRSYGGVGGGSGGGGGGNGAWNKCSGAGGAAGSVGQNGAVSINGGAGGAGTPWDPLTDIIRLVSYAAGPGGSCIGPANTYNGGGGGGGLILDASPIQGAAGTASQGNYSGAGGTGGAGYGGGGGGGTGANGAGGKGAPGVVYIEYYSRISP